MRLGGTARYAAEITSVEDLRNAVDWAESQKLPLIMIGGGSNIIWKDEGFDGLLLINKIKRYEVIERDPENIYVTVGAGEDWDSVVERTVNDGLSGIEALSLIPGTAGATPVQNVGAYGQEIADVFVSAEFFDQTTKKLNIMSKYECDFSYRNSVFKKSPSGTYLITAITLHLRRGNLEPPFYQALERYFNQYSITEYSPKNVREAVIKIRSSKLPDPKKVANNGSFFANPITDDGTFVQLQDKYPDIAHWKIDGGGVKLSAAWLIDQAGFKDYHDEETGMATWSLQPLVLVNEQAKTTADLLQFRDKIIAAVREKFDITLVQEPELLPKIVEESELEL